MLRYVLISLVTSTLVSWVQTQQLCPRGTSSIDFHVESQRSQTGNWVTKVVMGQGGGRVDGTSYGSEAWAVDVKANTSICDGDQSKVQVTFTLTAPLSKPGPDYELFPGIGFYKFHNIPKQWEAARQTCTDEGAHLVIINSEREDDVIKTLVARHPTIAGASSNDWLWVGIQRKAEAYFTIFGDKLETTGFTRWHPGQPNKNTNDNCILNHRISGGLNDVICDWIVGFTCEREL